MPNTGSELTPEQIASVIRAPPTKTIQNSVNNSSVPDVWGVEPGSESLDSSRIDLIRDSLRTKIETMNSFVDEPPRFIRKLFADADTQKDGLLDENEFVQLVCQKLNFKEYEKEVRGLFKRFDLDNSGKIDVTELGSALFGNYIAQASRTTTTTITANNNRGFNEYKLPGEKDEADRTKGVKGIIGKLREILKQRAGGSSTLKSLALQFKLLDRSGDGTVDKEELETGFNKFIRAYGLKLSKNEVDALIDAFDFNKDGAVTYDEFLHGIRGSMNDFRVGFVKQAFNILDEDGSGNLTLEEIAKRYDVSGHPQVKSGQLKPIDALRAFIANWHLSKKSAGDTISEAEFLEYYEWVSSSIDRDDYFELMMRNAWHIAGGEGWSANTSNLRVLVTHQDGHQTVECINDDLGLKRDDIEEIKRRLLKQGINAKSISLKD